MRAFSLVGLLVATCICLLIFAKFEAPVIQKGQQIKPIAQEMAGRGDGGEDAGHSITYDPDFNGNQLKGLVVKTIEAGGPMEKHFGLAVGDEITQVGQEDMGTFNNDSDLAAASVMQDGFEKDEALQVKRNGQVITLPAGANPDGSSGLQNQLQHMHLPAQP